MYFGTIPGQIDTVVLALSISPGKCLHGSCRIHGPTPSWADAAIAGG